MLFFKYVSDRYKGQKFAEFTISKGASFEDLIEAKGKSDVGERADKIIQKFLEDNQLIGSLPDVSFNNADELGSGKELVDKVSGLIGVFQNPAIDFKNNRASGDDIIGDAYEYFMMKFAQESGKSKGQFYTPSEVSRIIARLIGIADIKESPNKKWTLYDPAAGSGSLLIRAADEAPVNANGDSIVTIFGQESDRATAGLAKMNLILHQKGTGEIQRGNTLSSPKFIDEFGELKKFDFIVMNPPFSDKDWSDGIKTTEDEYKRFDGYGIPPEKNGDYAWFLHVLKSLDSNGKAGFVMPHGVLFRGNSEETIRQQILKKRYIKAIISLPANLFYGTGIPACIIILDKENTDTREDIFLIDASRGFKKDGNKNRLREQDIEKIVQTYTNRVEIKGYSKIVKYTDVLDENTNNGNLNVPRYIQKIDETLPQNIAAHLKGGIPETDIESLEKLWNIAPELKNIIFKCIDEVHKVYHLALASSEIESAIGEDINILAEKDNEIIKLFSAWKNSVKNILLGITQTTIPKDLIREISMSLLQKYEEAKLLDNYDVYDCLLNYWNAKLQDDVYTIKVAGYDVARELEYEYGQKKKKDENGKIVKDENGDAVMEDDTTKVKSFEGALIPKEIIESEFFADKLSHLNSLIEQSATIEGELDEMIEEESGEEGLLKEVLNDKGDGIPKANINDSRVVIITDRDELDDQIESLFFDVGENVTRAKSCANLREILDKNEDNIVCSLIHKYGHNAGKQADIDQYRKELIKDLPAGFKAKGNIIAFIDECHRTNSGKLHEAVKALMPDAVLIGFTGTPLLKKDKQTSLEIFGTYIHTYKFDEGVEDGVVLDLRYEARDVDQDLSNKDKLDLWFENKTMGLTERAKIQLKQSWTSINKLYSSKQRLEKIAADIVFDMSLKPRLKDDRGTAMLVANSIYEACRYWEIFMSMGFTKCAIVTSYEPTTQSVRTATSDLSQESEEEYKKSIYERMLGGNGYSGDLEIALIPEWFRTDILKEELDKNGVLVENSNITETEKFALPMHHDLWWKELFGCYYGGI